MSDTTIQDAPELVALPVKEIICRGVRLSRSTLIRAEQKGLIQTRLFTQPGSAKGRRYIVLTSLHAYIDSCMVDVPISSKGAA